MELVRVYNITVDGETRFFYYTLQYWHIDKLGRFKTRRCFLFVSLLFLPAAPIAYAIKVTEGTNVRLPCYLPPSRQERDNALWFKVSSAGKKTKLNLDDDLTDDFKKTELLYPDDPDQTIILRDIGMDDDGTYQCESAEGEKLSTVDIIVVGRFLCAEI